MEKFRVAKLKALIEHCYTHVPFYKNYMKQKKLHPNDVTSLAFLSELPVITKEYLKSRFAEFEPDNMKAQIKGVKIS